MKSKPEVFIIESLKLKDEKAGLFEGKILKEMLNFKEKNCIYYYIRTKKELVEVIDEFNKSAYRYLHISCHGNEHQMSLTLDKIPFSELGEILQKIPENRRIFLSSCLMASQKLAEEIIPKCRCYSILGSPNKIYFDDAVIFWTAFYHLMFDTDDDIMANDLIVDNAEKVAKMLNIKLNYFGRKTAHNFVL
jgi:hypothetical protein